MELPALRKVVFKTVLGSDVSGTVCDFLSERTGLSKGRVKDAMNKGAVWIQKKKKRMCRLRRLTAPLTAGDRIQLYYDPEVLALRPPGAKCLEDKGHYSVWYKPSGLLSQGSLYGDHCSLMWQAKLFFNPQRAIYLVHRLDREASGIMLLAHSRNAAARLSDLFHKNRIMKIYRAEVLGKPGGKRQKGSIDLPLDGKPCLTEFEVESYHPENNTSVVTVVIKTGRLHQIRRHFAMAGFPVLGDPRYGKGNKNTEGMKLSAVSLRFFCPFQNRETEFSAFGVNASVPEHRK